MKKIRVGITMGDPSGIGPAILVKALIQLKGLAEFVVIGDAWVLGKIPNPKSQIQNCKIIDLNNVSHKNFAFGKIRREYGRASIEYLDKALDLIIAREIDCLVTCPISKESVNRAGFHFPGHTEYLAKCCGRKEFAMMLLNRGLKFTLVTTHLPLKEVPGRINKEAIVRAITLTTGALKNLFKIKKPRLVVLGLNPHASDNGVLGKEEMERIIPAIRLLRKRLKTDIQGPLSADVAVLMASRGKFDAAIAMYHDQALIPLKLTGADSGVNMTIGLPFVRTSPLHGTAFDIADNPSLANPASLIEAVKVACQCASSPKKA
jgi:4-hydroxythreonine-4-phosphate dehydrogenase